MALHALRRGQRVKVCGIDFVILQRLPVDRWQLQNTTTGKYRIFTEVELLDHFAQDELSFHDDAAGTLARQVDLNRDLIPSANQSPVEIGAILNNAHAGL